MKKIYFLFFILIANSFVNAQCPSVTVSPIASTVICNGAPKTYTAMYTNPNNNATIMWLGPGASLVQYNVTTGTSPFVLSTANPGTYTFMIVDNTNTCVTSQTVQATSNTVIPQMTVSATSGYSLSCSQPSLQMNILISSSLAPIGYTWTNVSSSVSVSPPNGSYTITSPGYYIAQVHDGNFCTVSQTIQVIGICTGIEEQKNASVVSLYPNPNNGKFYIVASNINGRCTLKVMNTLGQEVHQQSIETGKNEISAPLVSKGVYYYLISGDSRSIGRGKFLVE